jgi:hypothetical protein
MLGQHDEQLGLQFRSVANMLRMPEWERNGDAQRPAAYGTERNSLKGNRLQRQIIARHQTRARRDHR